MNGRSSINWLWLGCVLLNVIPPWPRLAGADLIHTTLNVAFTRSNFLNVNRGDAEAAFKVFTATVGQRRGYLIESHTQIFETGSDFEAAIQAGAVDLAIIDTWDFVPMDIQGIVDPKFVSVEQRIVLEDYVLLTRRGSGLKTLADLRAKDVALLETTNTNLSGPWIRTLLAEHRFGDAEVFFHKIEIVNKPSAAVLPVFFGQKHACVVDRSGFDIMNELNPQVGKRLQIIAVSVPYLDTVICIKRTGWISDQYRDDLIEALGELHSEPSGQQILTLFKTNYLIPFKDEYVDSVRELKATYQRLIPVSNTALDGSVGRSSQAQLAVRLPAEKK